MLLPLYHVVQISIDMKRSKQNRTHIAQNQEPRRYRLRKTRLEGKKKLITTYICFEISIELLVVTPSLLIKCFFKSFIGQFVLVAIFSLAPSKLITIVLLLLPNNSHVGSFNFLSSSLTLLSLPLTLLHQ